MLLRVLGLASALAVASLAAPAVGRAQSQAALHPVSDAIYVGGRLEPDGAWLAAYDLDILVTDTRSGLSLGPSVSFAFGASGSNDLGRRQEWLLAADFLRARVSLMQDYGLRLMVVGGLGMWVASLPEQTSAPRPVLLPDGTTATGVDHFGSAFTPGGLVTLGAAADWYFDPSWAISAYLVGHIRLDQENRMPAFWMELGVGFRLGS